MKSLPVSGTNWTTHGQCDQEPKIDAALTTIVAAITSTIKKPYPFQVSLRAGEAGLDADSVVSMNHFRTIDHVRLIRRLGAIPAHVHKQVDRAICLSLGLPVASAEN
jgi:mRNA-degrading endonuclease toxin of MazEF toxin-antitoxin module